jgi:ornithine cyclodeaminase
VNLVGSSQLINREADDDVVASSRFFVDSRVSARAEAGELKHAMDAGLVSDSHVLGEIGEVLNGKVAGRTGNHDITVYKSLGVAAQDMAAARVIYDRAMRDGIGTTVPFFGPDDHGH